jgi:hypothetical protein
LIFTYTARPSHLCECIPATEQPPVSAYSHWTPPIENGHPQRVYLTNKLKGPYEYSILRWFLGTGGTIDSDRRCLVTVTPDMLLANIYSDKTPSLNC